MQQSHGLFVIAKPLVPTDTLRCAVILNFDPVTLIFDLKLTLNICSRPASLLSNSVRNFSVIEQSTVELLQFEYLINDRFFVHF